MIRFKIKKIGNHWYPCIKHDFDDCIQLDRKTEKYLNLLDASLGNREEFTIELEQLGIFYDGINTICFNEDDMFRYMTTDDDLQIRFVINNHEFSIHSDLYFLLEGQYNLDQESDYKIHVL